MTEKIDFKKTLASYRARSGRFDVLDVPELRYLMIDGHGDPNRSPLFAGAVEALYPVAYALKFASKAELGRDYVVMPLEGLWWADDMETFTTARDKSRWQWTLLLMIPEWTDEAAFDAAVGKVAAKGRTVRLGDVRMGSLVEGRCIQTLHVGPFDDEAAVLARMHDEMIPGAGLRMTGPHHEIYLTDPRRTRPEKQRTILRQPVAEMS